VAAAERRVSNRSMAAVSSPFNLSVTASVSTAQKKCNLRE